MADTATGEKSKGPNGGGLVVVGTGIQWAGQTTLAGAQAIRGADVVLFAVADPWAARWIRSLSPRAESLSYPRDGRPRKEIYEAMVERIGDEVRSGKRVCVVFYGSPAVLTRPAHEAVRRARSEGYHAVMLPGVSSIDCLFADLGVDPGGRGCAMFEAHALLARRPVIDTAAHLVLCQIALVGNRGPFDPHDKGTLRRGLACLGERLAPLYPAGHEAIVYEASTHPLRPFRADRVRLDALADAEVSEISTLYVPPVPAREDAERLAEAEEDGARETAA
jgi:precorrin-6B methylase 1